MRLGQVFFRFKAMLNTNAAWPISVIGRIIGSMSTRVVNRPGLRSERTASCDAPIEWPMPIMGWRMEERKVLIMWRRSRAWDQEHTGSCIRFELTVEEDIPPLTVSAIQMERILIFRAFSL